MLESEILVSVKAFAENILTNLPPHYLYHNFAHTSLVVDTTWAIASEMGLSEKATENLLIAAWMHDLGYAKSTTDHETASIEMAQAFLESVDFPAKRIEKVIEYIDATRMPQMPKNEKQMVLCDADFAHCAATDFLEKSENLRLEFVANGHDISERDWIQGTYTLFEEHHYFTGYGKKVLAPLKAINQEKVKERLKKLKKADKKEAKLAEEISQQVEKNKKPDRGIETMFRTTSSNHFQLSAMADNKANIMISVNTIIISLVVSILLRKLEDNEYLMIPTIMLTTVCLVATIFAILATIPNVTKGRVSPEDIKNRTANLLFFGNFYKMELADYEAGIKEMMHDSDFLYSSMTRDIYYLGKVLGKKYKMLRIAYSIFMYGFAASIIAFGIAVIFQK